MAEGGKVFVNEIC